MGCKLTHYVPSHAFMATMTWEVAERVQEVAGVEWVHHINSEHKIAPNLGSSAHSSGKKSTRKLTGVLLHGLQLTSAEVSQLIHRIRAATASPHVHVDGPTVRVEVAENMTVADTASWLAQQPEITYVEVSARFTPHNKFSKYVLHGRSGSEEDTSTPYASVAGLTGAGQIVGIADTGVDINHCAFYDNATTVFAFNANITHRKFVRYDAIADAADTDGHGTHVSGTLTGAVRSPVNDYRNLQGYNGYAPDAKISMQDIFGPDDEYVETCPNGKSGLHDCILPLAYSAGARVHSDSWGCGSMSCTGIYDYATSALDLYVWENKDFLPVFAAGNTGYYKSDVISSPALGKNMLTVGSTGTTKTGFKQICGYDGYANYTNDPFGYCPTADLLAEQWNPLEFTEESIPNFSSVGPVGGRIKPDVVAPGFVVLSAAAGALSPCNGDRNAASPNQAWKVDQGTSMSTPAVAGLALLIREYLQTQHNPIILHPSAALIKAIIINSAQPILGAHLGSSNWNAKVAWPGREQGFGRPSLTNTIPLAGYSIATGLYISDNLVASVSVNEQYTQYRFTTTSSGQPLRFTLAWTDYPSVLGTSTENLLVNNLDLSVVGPDGTIYAMNVSRVDSLNNVENVVINSASKGVYTVTVAHSFIVYDQPFSLVISGGIDSTSVVISQYNTSSSSTASPAATVPCTDCSCAPPCGRGFQCAVVARQITCQDVNECAINATACPVNKLCNNTIGSFTCVDHYFYIKHTISGLVLDFKGGSAGPNNLIVLATRVNTTQQQLWNFTSDGYIQHAVSGYVLDIQYAGGAGSNMIGYWKKDISQANNQRWSYDISRKLFVSLSGNIALDVYSTTPGAQVIVSTAASYTSEEFELTL